MLMASGANFGFRRTVPHMAGIWTGFSLLTAVVGAGLSRIFDAYPVSYTILKVASIVYLLFLASKIATAAPLHHSQGRSETETGGEKQTDPAESTGSPITFVQAALFQWVNPKAWAMGLTAITAYSPGRSLGGVAVVVAVFATVNIPTITLWTYLGENIRRWLTNSHKLRVFNIVMAILLVLSLMPVLFM